PDLRVHRKRKVDRRCATGELLHVALRREDEDLVLEQIDPEELHELLRLARVLLPLEDLAEPGERLVDLVARAVRALLVAPVRRDTVLGRAVHLRRADLDLVEPSARTEDRRVQRPVHVRLRRGDVVVEPLLERRPLVVDHAERMITVGDRVRDAADRPPAVDLLVRAAALLLLPADRPEMLRTTVDLARDPGVAQLLLVRLAQGLDVLLALRALVRDLLCERAILLRLEMLEGQVLELPADLRHTEPVGERRVDLARLRRDAAPLVRPQV